MPLIITFLLGVGNFALNRAVMNSGHPLLNQAQWLYTALGGRLSIAIEFLLLLGTMLFITNGAPGAAVAYIVYSMLNSFSAWLILTRKI